MKRQLEKTDLKCGQTFPAEERLSEVVLLQREPSSIHSTILIHLDPSINPNAMFANTALPMNYLSSPM
jgi:hypothetical protein